MYIRIISPPASFRTRARWFEKDFKKTDGTCDCLAELFDHVGKSGFCVLMETGTYAYPPYRFFRDRGCDVDCVHAQCLKMITQTDKKKLRRLPKTKPEKSSYGSYRL